MAFPHDSLTGSAREVADALAGRYTVEKELGRGGMATVYLARDLKHDRHVAIKVLHPDLAASLGAERFLREIKIAARLNHPHILPVHDSGEAGGFLFYVMPFAEGESLRDRLTREKQLPVEDALRIAREVADALSYAHAHDVVHRDIKPENILLDAGHAVVADFGIARAISAAGGDKLTQTGMSVGTPAYMSPEQASASGDVDGRSDLYSLACVLFEMLAGQPPFTGPTLESIVRQHIVEEPPSITRIRPAVSGNVAAALMRALAKAPADRFNPVALFGEALGRHENVAPRSAGATGRWAPRRAGQLAIAAVAVIAVVLGGLRIFRGGESGTSTGARTVIAVLPLQNLTADTAHSFFAGGLHDEILSQLSRIGSLRVISRTSVLGYAGTGTSLREIGSELGAGSVVEGSVQVIGERLRVIVQLIDASSDAHIWSNTYDRTLDDAFAIQSDVAKQIVAAVGAALTATEQRGLAEQPTSDSEAYQLYLQGREYSQRPGSDSTNLRIAQEAFERAIARDPGFALAHAALSTVHGRMYWFRHDPRPARAEMQLRDAREAIRLAPELPEAHHALGLAHYWGRRDYAEALKEFSIAEKGRPNDAELIAAIASVHRRLGNWTEVVAAFERAAQLSPRDADLFRDLGGSTFHRLGRFDEAVQAYARASSLAPDVHVAAILRGIAYVRWRGQLDTLRAVLGGTPHAQLLLWEREADSLLVMVAEASERVFAGQNIFIPTALYAAWAHEIRGDPGAARTAYGEASALLDSVARELPDDWRVAAAHGLALAGLGRRTEALRMAEKLQQSAVYRDAFIGVRVAEERARILAQAGATDAALEAIERLLAAPSSFTVHLLRLDPLWDPIREDARFKLLLTKYARAP